jgi:hypothetical protein
LPSLKPKQKKELKRSRKATVMYTENEYAKIEANAREMEVTVSSYIRAKSPHGYARVPKHSKIYAKSVKELSEKSKEQKVPQPLGNTNWNSENWSAYIKAKTEHSGDKKERRQRLYMTQHDTTGRKERTAGQSETQTPNARQFFWEGCFALGNQPAAFDTREAVARHERFKEYAAEEARRLHPDAAAIIREDDMKREREELARRETEEAKVRIEKENHRRFRASILELAAKFVHEAPIVTDAQDGRTFSGLIMGAAERDGRRYAVQMIGGYHVILHYVEKGDLPQIASIVGKRVEIKCLGRRIRAIEEVPERHERSRGRGR